MKTLKKLTLIIVLILIFMQLSCKYSLASNGLDKYGRVGFSSNWDCKDIKTFLGLTINDFGGEKGGWYDGWNSCSQANNDSGYSSTIRAVYETFYDDKLKTIAACSISVGREGGDEKKSENTTSKNIRNFAASMSIGYNIPGVRSALMKCVSGKQLSYSSTLMSNNYDGRAYGGSSAAWETTNKETRQKYINYYKITAIDSKTSKAKYEQINNTNYVVMGPYKMKFGGSKIEDIKINGKSIVGKDVAMYRIAGEKTLHKYINDLKANGGGAYAFNNKKFYIYVKENKIKDYVGNNNTATITFKQEKFTYQKGRVFICNQYNGNQGSVWYTQTNDSVEGKVSFECILDDSINIKVKKIWNDGKSKSRPKYVKVTLTADGHAMNSAGATSLTKTIKSSNTCTFTGLRRYDENGNLMKYTITEAVPKKYVAKYSPQSITVNKKSSVYTFNITNEGPGKKQESGDPNAGDLVITKERRRNVF